MGNIIKRSKDTDDDPALALKITVIGSSGVGKTSFVYQFDRNKMPETHEPTLGASVSFKSIEIENKNTRVEFWDVSGLPRYQELLDKQMYISGSDALIIIYNPFDRNSFTRAKQYSKHCEGLNAILIANWKRFHHDNNNNNNNQEQQIVSDSEGMPASEDMSCLFTSIDVRHKKDVDSAVEALIRKELGMPFQHLLNTPVPSTMGSDMLRMWTTCNDGRDGFI